MSNVIYTIEKAPVECWKIFDYFVDILAEKELWMEGTRYQLVVTEKRDNLSAIFQIYPSANVDSSIYVGFIEENSTIHVTYESQFEMRVPNMMGMGRLMKRMAQSQQGFLQENYDRLLIPLITSSVNEALDTIEEETYGETDREPGKASSDDPLEILKIRFAKGEITEEEYLRKKKLLE